MLSPCLLNTPWSGSDSPSSPLPPTCVSDAVELMPSKSRSLSAFWSPLMWWPLDSEPFKTVPFSVGPGPQRGCQMAVPVKKRYIFRPNKKRTKELPPTKSLIPPLTLGYWKLLRYACCSDHCLPYSLKPCNIIITGYIFSFFDTVNKISINIRIQQYEISYHFHYIRKYVLINPTKWTPSSVFQELLADNSAGDTQTKPTHCQPSPSARIPATPSPLCSSLTCQPPAPRPHLASTSPPRRRRGPHTWCSGRRSGGSGGCRRPAAPSHWWTGCSRHILPRTGPGSPSRSRGDHPWEKKWCWS